MILFELRCSHDHHFEAWFRDGAAYDAQAQAGEIACPECGSAEVSKAIMAPRINSARGEAVDVGEGARALRHALRELRRAVERNCDYVGDRFPEEARKIFYGEVEPRAIYGEASAEQAVALEEEGVEVGRIPWAPLED
ncbi:MAG: DUF1178 family protein [Magnetospirillum sp.]|nr:DUF1178 family protein [Magnetospirillum sp.]